MSILVRGSSMPSSPEKQSPQAISELLPQLPKPGHCIQIRNLDWKTYQAISKEYFTDRPAFMLAYDEGTLEIMAASRLHEKLSMLLAQIVHVLCEELNLTLSSDGSTTLDREDLNKGIEPDQCFYIFNEPRMRHRDQIELEKDPPPDLAIEVDITSKSINRLGIYAAIGVPEAWRYDGKNFEIRHLTTEGKYLLVAASKYFPTIPLAEIHGFLTRRHDMDSIAWVREFRAWVREQIAASS